MDNEILIQQINIVARARLAAKEAEAAKDASYFRWLDEANDLIAKRDETGDFVRDAEARLRELTLEAYKADPTNKRPVQGVSVKLFQRLEYNQEEAKSWCMEHRVALKLDTASFEKLAQVEKLSFVTISEEARAQIASDLPLDKPPSQQN